MYLVGNKDKTILRVSKRLPVGDVIFEYEALQHLYSGGFSVPAWIKTKDGEVYASIYDSGVAVMFDFLEGYHAKIDKDNVPTAEQAYTAGRALGSIAEIGTSFNPSSSRKRNIFVELERVIQYEDVFKKDFEGGEVFVEQVKQAIVFAQESDSAIGLIHNDYRPGNVFFKNDNEISGVIDFDWSCIGPTMKDLALGVLEWSFPDGRTEPDINIFDAFLSGYNSVSKTTYVKNKVLYAWIMFADLSDTSTYFCDRLEDPNSTKRILTSYMYRKYLFYKNM